MVLDAGEDAEREEALAEAPGKTQKRMAPDEREGLPAGPAAGPPAWKAGTTWPRGRGLRARPSELFPLPLPHRPAPSTSSSRHSKRSGARRALAFGDVSLAVRSLNCMYGFRDPSVSDDAEVTRSDAQQAVRRGLVNLLAQGRPSSLLPPVAAARALLGDKFDYLGPSCKVRPFGPAPVSLPSGLRPPVDVIGDLGPGCEEVLTEDHMVKDDDESKDTWQQPRPGSFLGETLRA